MSDPSPLVTPSIKRRIAALPYEVLLLAALLFLAAFPAAGLKGITLSGAPLFIFQVYLFCVTATYFTWFWRHGGQTLAMRTWRFRVVRKGGEALNFKAAFTRFVLSTIFYGPAVAGLVLLLFPDRISRVITMWAFLPMLATLLWARYDADRQFLHDSMSGTRLVEVQAVKSVVS